MSTLSVTTLTTGASTTSLTVLTGNSSATGIMLSSNGNVGIGTTTPNYSGYGTSNLTVKGGTTLQGVIELVGTRADADGNAAGDINFITTAITGADKRLAQIQATQNGSTLVNRGGALNFYTKIDNGSLTNRMIIDSSGNVGIGTTSPGQKLSVLSTGLISYFNSTTNDGYIRVDETDGSTNVFGGTAGIGFVGTSSNYPFTIRTNNIERMRIDSSGNVYIGSSTASISEKLLVKGAVLGGTIGNVSYNSVFYTPDTTNITRLNILDYRFATGTSHPSSMTKIQRRVDTTDMGYVGFDSTGTSVGWQNTEAMRIDASGNVGIGTTSPGGKLHVQSSGTSNPTFIAEDGFIVSSTGGAGYTTAMNIVSGTTGVSRIKFSSSTTNNLGAVAYDMTNNALYFNTNGANERMRIDASGNLLVGTTAVNFAGSGFTLSTNSGTTKWLVGPTASATSNFYVTAASSLGVYLAGTSATSWSAASDERLKDIIEPIADGLQKVNTLRAVIGSYKADEAKTRRAFLIAQDLQNVLPEAVDASNPDALGVQYTEVIPLLVAAIKELSAKVAALEAK